MDGRAEHAATERWDEVAAVTQWRAPRWVAPLFGAATVVLVLWLVALVDMLPSSHRVSHWDVAWGGFDAVLALLLLSVAVAAWRRSPRLEPAATAAATLLLIDAWFDVTTANAGADFVLAVAEAAVVEVPLALLCLLLARDTERRFLRPVLDFVARSRER